MESTPKIVKLENNEKACWGHKKPWIRIQTSTYRAIKEFYTGE